MSQDAEPTTPDPSAPNGSAPDEQAQADAANEAVYDEAFSEIMGANASTPPPAGDTPTDEGAQETDGSPEGSDDEPEGDDAPAPLTDDQRNLLGRLHMTEEMIAGWSAEQRNEFLANAAKREADQDRGYSELAQRLKKLEQGQGGDDAGEGEQQGGQPTNGGKSSEFAKQATEVVDKLVDDYGDEMKPVGALITQLVTTTETLQQNLERSQQGGRIKDQLIVETTLELGLRDLASDYPSLDKADARDKVTKRFEAMWKDPGNAHASDHGKPLLPRIKACLRDAASAEFGNVTEAAAQVALANKTKTRLANQPPAGSGKGRQKPATADDVYDHEFNTHLRGK